MAEKSGLEVVASGGIKDIEDIRALKEHEGAGVAGAILGKSLYMHTLDLKEALAVAGA